MTTAAEVVSAASARGALPELQALLVEPTWREVLAAEFEKPGIKQLQRFLHREWAEQKVFPPQAEIFRCCSNSSGMRTAVTEKPDDATHLQNCVVAVFTPHMCWRRAMNSCPFDAVEVVILGGRRSGLCRCIMSRSLRRSVVLT